MQILSSARKHGISDADIRHAFRFAITYVEIEYEHAEQILAIGPARDGTLLELICVPVEQPQRVIHADRLRPKYYDLLR